MTRAIAAIGVALASSGAAWAGEAPPYVKPFLTGDESVLWTTKGAFGPSAETTVALWWDIMGPGSYKGFALVPDPKAKDGYRKLTLPKLPVGVTEGEMQLGLIANLDKDPANEIAIAVKVSKSGGGYSYSAYDYVVLDWNGSKLVRVPALESKLAKAMKARSEGASEVLSEADLRKTLGIAKP